MSEINISQAEADAFISMEKIRLDEECYEYPALGGGIIIPLSSRNKRDNFLLDISKGRIDLLKGKYQNRALQTVILLRLDFGGQPHRNPDGNEILSPHLHVYREGFGDKWAVPVSKQDFENIHDLWQTLQDFMRYCNIVEPPNIERGLFI
ncbi:MAG: hypothetical protein WC602_00140 [archaeon]